MRLKIFQKANFLGFMSAKLPFLKSFINLCANAHDRPPEKGCSLIPSILHWPLEMISWSALSLLTTFPFIDRYLLQGNSGSVLGEMW